MMEADIRTSRCRLPSIGHCFAAFVYNKGRIIIGLSRMARFAWTFEISIERNKGEGGPGKEERVDLGWKDYLALVIAAVEKVLLGYVRFMILLLANVLLWHFVVLCV